MGLFKKKLRFPSTSDVDRKQRADERRELKREEERVYQEAFKKGRLERARQEGLARGKHRWTDVFADMGGFQQPSRVSSGKRKHKKRKSGGRQKNSGGNSFNLFGDFDPFDNQGLL